MLATAATRRNYEANIISINLTEANKKIEFVRNFYHSMPDDLKEIGLKPKLWNDASNTIGLHEPPNTSYLVSQPASSAVRGGKKDIYFDEAAHIRDFNTLYRAAAPAIVRGSGRISIVSTPLGQSGLFYEIINDTIGHDSFSRHIIPWWESRFFVVEGALFDAYGKAADMGTKERVDEFGNNDIKEMFYGTFAEDMIGFQTEFECMFVDEAEAYFPWGLVISANTDDANDGFWKMIPVQVPEADYAIGVDIAKERDESVFTVSEIDSTDATNIHRTVRYIHATQEPYDDQLEFLNKLAQRVKPRRISIDKTGVGNMFFEQSHRIAPFGGSIEGVVFTNAKKEEWATKFKGDLQLANVHYPYHSELVRQVHGIRRTKTEANFYKFAGKPRDDYFWSLMLSLYGENRPRASITFL